MQKTDLTFFRSQLNYLDQSTLIGFKLLSQNLLYLKKRKKDQKSIFKCEKIVQGFVFNTSYFLKILGFQF